MTGSSEGKTFWERLGDSYYGFCDWLQDHGIPIYDFFVYPLEDRGIPSLPAFVIILLLLLLGVGWAATGFSGLNLSKQPQSYSLSITVYSESGPIEGATLSLSQDGSLVSKAKSSQDGGASFDELAKGDYSLEVEKPGFDKAKLDISIPRDSSVDITLVSSQGSGYSDKQPDGKGVIESDDLPELDYSDDLSLNIYVTSIAGSPLNATANVFDKNSGTKLGTVSVRAGFGSFEGLEEGMVVYADIASQGYVSYFGRNNATTISSEHPNSISVKLFRISNETESKATIVKVKDSNATALANVLIKVYQRGSNSVLTIPEQYTNSTGELAIDLNSTGNPDYKILASKSGYVDKESGWFKAGSKFEMTLKKQGELNQSEKDHATNITVSVSFNGSSVANAAVSVFSEQFTTREGFTDQKGKISFYILDSRGLTVTVNASKNNLLATQLVPLNSEQVRADLELQRRQAGVRVRAFNYSNGLLIENAAFEAKTSGQTVSSCAVSAPDFDCVLRIGIGLNAEINASAPTFISEEKFLAVNNETLRLDFSLLPEYAVQSSQIKDFVVTLEGGNSNVTTLYPGKRYEAKFSLIGKTNSANDEFGFYFAVDSARAVIKRVTPPSAAAKTLGSGTAACAPMQIDYANANAAWVDLTYAGSEGISSKSVKAVFEVKSLQQNVQEDNLTLRYRSFLVQGGKYYRNPLNVEDPPETRFEPKTPLPSGCNSPAFSKIYAINGAGISCSDFACVSVFFSQGGRQSAKDNFTMFSNGSNTPPVVLTYGIMLKKNVARNPGAISFSFDAPGGFIGLESASYPDAPDAQGTPPEPPNKVVFFNDAPSSFSVDLSYLKSYSNMEAGFSFTGAFAIKILSQSNVTGEKITLSLTQGIDAAVHDALYNIAVNTTSSGGGGGGNNQSEESAKLEMALRQRKDNGNYISDPLSLYAVGLCSLESILNSFFQVGLPKCAGSFVELNYTATVNDTAGGRGWVFFNASDNGVSSIYNLTVSKQRGNSLYFTQGLEGRVFPGFFNESLADVAAGDVLKVSFLAVTGETPGFSQFKFVFNNGKNNLFANRTKLNALPSSGGGQDASFDYFPCGKAAITLDISPSQQGGYDFTSSCGDAILQVDPIMPLDAIPVEFTENFKSRCGTLLFRFDAPTDQSRDLSQKIVFDKAEFPLKPAWISFDAFAAGLLKGNSFDTDERFPGLNYLGKAKLRLDCSALPGKFYSISLTARAADSRIPAIDGSYIYYEGMPRQLVYSLYNGQLPRDLVISPSNEPTAVKTRTRAFDANSRVNYFFINHNSVPIGVAIKDAPADQGISITQFNNRFGSVYSHMIAVSHLDLLTLGKYLHFLDSVERFPPTVPNGIWNSTCPAIDYVSEVTHQIPRNFAEEAKRISLITGFRRSPPQNGYWCGHRKDRPQGERTCYPTILNWMQPGISETRQTIQCTPACLQAGETDPEAYSPDSLVLSVSPQNAFPAEGEPYGFKVSDSLELSADASGLPEGTVVSSASVEFKKSGGDDCPIFGSSWCSTAFLNDGVELLFDQPSGLWKISYSGIASAQNGEYAVRVKAANETGGIFYYSPWLRIMVQNGAAACFPLDTQRESVPLCAEPVCDPFCGSGGTKEIVTNAGPDLQNTQAWWLNDTQLEFVPAARVEGIERYQGMPFAYFKRKGTLQNAFSLSSPLMQWNWNIDDAAAAGFQLENGVKCEQGTGFYELKASSANGTSWAFKAELKKLPLSGYLLNTEPSDSSAARDGYVTETPPSPRSDVYGKGWGCGIGTDPDFQDVKFLCNAKNLVIAKHVHFDTRRAQRLDCFTPCKNNNCGYCINYDLPFVQYEWQSCLPPSGRELFSSLQELRQASTNPNLPPAQQWAFGAGQEFGGCPNEATRISD